MRFLESLIIKPTRLFASKNNFLFLGIDESRKKDYFLGLTPQFQNFAKIQRKDLVYAFFRELLLVAREFPWQRNSRIFQFNQVLAGRHLCHRPKLFRIILELLSNQPNLLIISRQKNRRIKGIVISPAIFAPEFAPVRKLFKVDYAM